jgi:hypothetical protein
MMPPSIVLAPIQNLKECNPNLMPFHIDYSGPAPISTYFLVEPASETVGAPRAESMEKEASASCTAMGTDARESAIPPPATVSCKDSCDTENPETINDEQETPLALEHPRLSLAKRVTDATTRFISSFRGRKIQGLKVEMPPGYVGVVLKSDAMSSEIGRAAGRATRKVSKAKPKTRSTRSTTRVIDVDERDMHDAMDVDESCADPAVIRTLAPVSQFSSFVLWHADHPVDEGRDEYFRSLTEWTRLAHEVSCCSATCIE